MIKRILVPLDGSNLSEQVLWQVRRLLIEEEAHVELYTVVVPILESWLERSEDRPDREQRHPDLRIEDARRSLKRVAKALSADGVSVSCEVDLGDPADMILRHAERTRPSLVAMATHGRSGLGRWLRGSVAQRVLRACPVPLLLVNPGARGVGDVIALRFPTILVPLDGSERAGEVLPLVEEFARIYDSEVVLLRVVPEDSLEIAQRAFAEELEPVRKRLGEAGLGVSLHVVAGDPAAEILDAAKHYEADLVAMATHGLRGLDRWLLGSVSEKVLRRCPVPLLLQRTAGPTT